MAGSRTSPNAFFVLLVDDEPEQYSARLRKAITEVLTMYDVDENLLVWDETGSRDDALQLLKTAEDERRGRGYDAIIADLRIFAKGSAGGGRPEDLDWRNGLKVLEASADYGWIGARLCLSTFANEPDILKTRAEVGARIAVDDWLFKTQLVQQENYELLKAKLRRCLVPVERWAAWLRKRERPIIIENPRMKRVLRQLVFLARRDYTEWPLARILLLGEPGAGKGALSRAFREMLPRSADRPDLVMLNCASTVSEGHGGRIALFGAEGFGSGVGDQPGIFERASFYGGRGGARLAPKGANPEFDRAGVVLLDEFAELPPDLQASILTALEEGRIRREGSGNDVKIACHVVFSTNVNIDRLGGSEDQLRSGERRVREDLLDRIPYILEVPPLSERRDEVERIIVGLAEQRLRRYHPDEEFSVEISPSALRILDRALNENIITSVRQLQMLSDVLAHERLITESNLVPLLEKAEVMRKGARLISDEGERVSLKERAQRLKLPEGLCRNDLPASTVPVISRLYDSLRAGGRQLNLSDIQYEDREERVRCALIVGLLPDDVRSRIVTQTPEAIRKWRERVYATALDEGFNLPPAKTPLKERNEAWIQYLSSGSSQG